MEIWEVLSAVAAGLCTGVIGLALARLPRSTVSTPVYCFVLSGVFWAVGDLIADAAVSMGWKQVGVSLLYTGSIAMPALWWTVVLRWSEEVGAALPFRGSAWTTVPLVFAALMWAVMITNPWHGAFLTPVVGGRNLYQPLWYAMALPNYALILAALGIEVEVARRVYGREVRRQAAFLISASLVTLLGNVVYVTDLVSINLTVLVLSTSGALLVVGMAREGLFGVLPSAFPTIAADHPDGLVVAGLSGDVRFANDRARDLLAPIEIRPELRLPDLLRDLRLRAEAPGPGEEQKVDDQWEHLLRTDSMTFRLTSGAPRWLSLRVTVVRGRRGATKGFTLQISDLTRQKQAELHLRQTRRLDSVAVFARRVSRELQGILAVVHGNAELLAAERSLVPRSQRQAVRIVDAAKRGFDLAYELQLYTGTFTTRRVLLELSEIVEESCELVEDDLPSDVRLLYARAKEALPVHVDAFQIRQSIFHLLMNAIDAMALRAGPIEVETGACRIDPAEAELVCGNEEPAGDFAYVRVRDYGPAMDPETEERAFEPFFSTRGKERGSGLPTVLGIARAHGALLALDNADGCTFTLYFPLEREAGSA